MLSNNLEHLIFSLYEIVYIRNYLEYVTDDAPIGSKALDEVKQKLQNLFNEGTIDDNTTSN